MNVWVLGAPDPEMSAIESLLQECGETVVYAANDQGERIRGGEAYRAKRISAEFPSGVTSVTLVECDLVHPELADCTVERIDHHRPGDHGFGRPPSEFLPASSIGQVIVALARLGRLPETSGPLRGAYSARRRWERGHGHAVSEPVDPWAIRGLSGRWTVREPLVYDGATQPGHFVDVDVPHDLILTAAADHCLGAAYMGDCPGVDPDALMRWRAQSRATFQRREVADVLADIERACTALHVAPRLTLSGRLDVRDMRGTHVPELPEAGTREGISYIADGIPDRDGRKKVVCSGSPEVVRAFLEWAPSQGLYDCYGDPSRGFAGGYEEAER